MKGNKFVQRHLFTFTLSFPSVRADLMNKGLEKRMDEERGMIQEGRGGRKEGGDEGRGTRRINRVRDLEVYKLAFESAKGLRYEPG